MGLVKVKVTVAPIAGLAPLITVAVMGTVERTEYAGAGWGIDNVTASGGAGAVTVQLAMPVAERVPLVLVASTG